MSGQRRRAGPRADLPSPAPPSRESGRGRDRSAAFRIGAALVGLMMVGVFAFRTILSGGSGESPTVAVAATATVPMATVAPGTQVTFVIEKGDTTTTVSERLAQMGLVQSARAFRFLVIWRGAEDRLRAGSFILRQGMTMDQLIEAFLASQVREVSVTFIEGRRIEEHAETLGKSGANVDSAQFLALAREGTFAYDFMQSLPKGATAEGYLFPDTYRVIPGETTADQLLQLMLKRFGQVGTPKFLEDARKATRLPDLTMHQLVTIASVVEREAVLQDERAKIAAVYLNRYRDGEGLFADPTVQYAAGKAGAWWPVLREAPRAIVPDSPYNTYVARGLPPGPICSPGEASLRAVAAPDTTSAKYFVRNDVKNDGSHVFATTLAEHEANRVKYQR
jgi:UPF0755 protein